MKMWSMTAFGVLPASILFGSLLWVRRPVLHPPQTLSRVVLPLPKSPWRISHSANPVDHSPSTYIARGDFESGGMVLGCNGKRLDVYVAAPEQQLFDRTGGHRRIVSLSFGGKLPIAQSWIVSASYDGLFAPSPTSLVKTLIEQRQLAMTYKVGDIVCIDKC